MHARFLAALLIVGAVACSDDIPADEVPTVDSSVTNDGGAAMEAGRPDDAGPPPDAQPIEDTGAQDANSPMDGGDPPFIDSGIRDGAVADSTIPDTGPIRVEDAGFGVPCCVNNRITTCFCDGGIDCDFGEFIDCGDQICVGRGQTCPQ